MDKIRYRLVYNRQKKLNKQGTALVQIEAYLNQRKIYLKTNVYLKPECWSREGAQVINHPQSNELNAMLYEYILYLQGIELGYWKRGIPATLSLLKDAVKKKSAVNISFSIFAKSAIDNSDKKQSPRITCIRHWRSCMISAPDWTSRILPIHSFVILNNT